MATFWGAFCGAIVGILVFIAAVVVIAGDDDRQ